jgi:hypothetical protein
MADNIDDRNLSEVSAHPERYNLHNRGDDVPHTVRATEKYNHIDNKYTPTQAKSSDVGGKRKSRKQRKQRRKSHKQRRKSHKSKKSRRSRRR